MNKKQIQLAQQVNSPDPRMAILGRGEFEGDGVPPHKPLQGGLS